MKLIAITPLRNESWICGLTLRASLMFCDEVVVLAHACTDGTVDIVHDVSAEHPGRVHLIVEPDPLWAEMDHRQRLLEAARKRGATHVAHLDGDELLTGNLIPYIREQLESLPAGGFLQTGMPCIWRSFGQWRDDNSVFGHSLTMLGFRDAPHLGWKPKADGYTHHSREPIGARMAARLARECGGLMHLQFLGWRRLVAKHALYKMIETIRWPGRKTAAEIDHLYSMAPNEVGAKLSEVPGDWLESYDSLFQYVDLDQVPWQEAECRRLWKEHGAETFRGLNLFGVIEQKETVAA